MRQNRQSILVFPKFNKEVFILPSEAKALLENFTIRRTRLAELWTSDKDDTLGLVHGLRHMT